MNRLSPSSIKSLSIKLNERGSNTALKPSTLSGVTKILNNLNLTKLTHVHFDSCSFVAVINLSPEAVASSSLNYFSMNITDDFFNSIRGKKAWDQLRKVLLASNKIKALHFDASEEWGGGFAAITNLSALIKDSGVKTVGIHHFEDPPESFLASLKDLDVACLVFGPLNHTLMFDMDASMFKVNENLVDIGRIISHCSLSSIKHFVVNGISTNGGNNDEGEIPKEDWQCADDFVDEVWKNQSPFLNIEVIAYIPKIWGGASWLSYSRDFFDK